ncbi:MAG: DUF2007 domain-containing protein [Chloroflexi bacterium]|nr:DUF2007 domain-containing protein [Chloroflexota bacterium]
MKWVEVSTAPDQLTAEMWVEILRNGGVPAMVNPEDYVSYLGVSAMPCRVMVPENRLREAQLLLTH